MILNIGAGNTYTLTYDPTTAFTVGPSIILGQEYYLSPTAGLTIASGTLSAYDMRVGSTPFGNGGSLMVQNGADVILADELHVADVSSGSVNIAGAGSTVTCENAHFGLSGSGNLLVQSGGSFTASGELVLGSTFSYALGLPIDGPAGSGTISVVGGSQLSAATVVIGGNFTDVGSVPISGDVFLANPGSTWTTTSELTVGYYSTGNSFTVSQGATLATGSATTFVGREGLGSQGEISVNGPGSTWNHGAVYVGSAGTGELTIELGADAVGFGGPVVIAEWPPAAARLPSAAPALRGTF